MKIDNFKFLEFRIKPKFGVKFNPARPEFEEKDPTKRGSVMLTKNEAKVLNASANQTKLWYELESGDAAEKRAKKKIENETNKAE